MDACIDAVHTRALVKNRMRFHRDPETGWDNFWPKEVDMPTVQGITGQGGLTW